MSHSNTISPIPPTKEALLDKLDQVLQALADQTHSPLLSHQMGYVEAIMVKVHQSEASRIDRKMWQNICGEINTYQEEASPTPLLPEEKKQRWDHLKDTIQTAYNAASEASVTPGSHSNEELTDNITLLPTRGATAERLRAACENKLSEVHTYQSRLPEGETNKTLDETETVLSQLIQKLSNICHEKADMIISRKEWDTMLNTARETIVSNADHFQWGMNVDSPHTDTLFETAIAPQTPSSQCSDAQTPENLCEARAEALDR